MDMELHTEKIKKLEQELAEVTAAEKDEKEVVASVWCQFDLYFLMVSFISHYFSRFRWSLRVLSRQSVF